MLKTPADDRKSPNDSHGDDQEPDSSRWTLEKAGTMAALILNDTAFWKDSNGRVSAMTRDDNDVLPDDYKSSDQLITAKYADIFDLNPDYFGSLTPTEFAKTAHEITAIDKRAQPTGGHTEGFYQDMFKTLQRSVPLEPFNIRAHDFEGQRMASFIRGYTYDGTLTENQIEAAVAEAKKVIEDGYADRTPRQSRELFDAHLQSYIDKYEQERHADLERRQRLIWPDVAADETEKV